MTLKDSQGLITKTQEDIKCPHMQAPVTTANANGSPPEPCSGGKDPGGKTGLFFHLFKLDPLEFDPKKLVQLGERMTNADDQSDTSFIPAGYTYLGQFIGHDLTRFAPNTRSAPTSKFKQQRTPTLDLDSVYGKGFDEERIRRDAASGKMLLDKTNGSPDAQATDDDLPREDDGRAQIPDDRNDENLIILQLHVQFLKLHNLFVDKSTRKGQAAFEEARRLATLTYQEIVVYDFLNRVLDPEVLAYYFDGADEPREYIWDSFVGKKARIPLEFSGAAFRFGHSMVLDRYVLNNDGKANLNLKQLLRVNDSGACILGKKLQAIHKIDWGNFFEMSVPHAGPFFLAGRIAPFVSVRFGNETALAARNLETGQRLGLPSGQSLVNVIARRHQTLAQALALLPLSGDALDFDTPFHGRPGSENLLKGLRDTGITEATPLWYYILAEALRQRGGRSLGKLGSILIAETIRGLLKLGPISILDKQTSSSFISETNSIFTRTGNAVGATRLQMSDVLRAVMSHAAKSEIP